MFLPPGLYKVVATNSLELTINANCADKGSSVVVSKKTDYMAKMRDFLVNIVIRDGINVDNFNLPKFNDKVRK